MLNYQVLTEKLLQINQNICLLKTFDSSHFIGKSHFEEDGTQNYLYFNQCRDTLNKLLVLIMATTFITENLKGCLMKELILLQRSNYSVTPFLDYYGTKIRVEFSGSRLKQDKITNTHGKAVNIYIVYEISKSINISDYPTLENCLFGAVSLTKNADIDKSGYSGYGIGFDGHGSFSFSSTGLGRNIIIFGVDMSSSTKIDKRKKDILILGKGPTQRLEHILSAEKIYSINFK